MRLQLRILMETTNFAASLKIFILMGVIVILALTSVLVSSEICKNFLVVESCLTRADALVVMAGSREERLPAAADLYKEGMAYEILLANDGVSAAFSQDKQRNLYQVEWAEEELVKQGVPLNKIVKLPFYGSATMFDAIAVKKYLLQSGLQTIIVVTSDYHTRRTAWTFRHILKNTSIHFSVFPAKSYTVDSKGIAIEFLKLCYYQIRYGLLDLIPVIH
ncbi:MAG: YdcF family protein [Desulfobulbaceae bacterium]|nr:MAG: YdcF family protein [Desulfobulbaceae bacterium]